MGKQVEDKEYHREQAEKLIRELPKALLNWYSFRKGSRILYIGGKDAYAEVLEEYTDQIMYVGCEELREERWQVRFEAYFDHAVCVETLEKEEKPSTLLGFIRKSLKPDGTFLLGMNNRLGFRYFCGDRDPYTKRSFDGVENYRRAYAKKEDAFYGRMYDREELKKLLLDAGWKKGQFQFFSVLADLHNPSLIYQEDSVPGEDLAIRLTPVYNYPDSVFLEEEFLYRNLTENGMFHQMANACLIECSASGVLSDVSQVTGSMDRGREAALLTIIHKSGLVEKRAAFPEGQIRLERLVSHGEELKARGLKVVDARMIDGICEMPYVDAEVGHMYLKRLLETDRDQFLKTMDQFRDLILQSSEIVEPDKGDGEGAVLKKGYLELIPLNSFYIDGDFVLFDQEVCEENYPANALIFRTVASLYGGSVEMQKLLPIDRLFERYGIAKYYERWRRMEWEYLSRLLNKNKLHLYHEACRRNPEIVNANRQRMNYSEMDYQRLFVDVFKGVQGRRLILFGSGVFAKRFIGMFGKDFSVYAIVDNNKERWGQQLDGVKIQSPDILREIPEGEYKVIICVKNFLSITRQLDQMGIKNYGIFDSSRSYPLSRPETVCQPDAKNTAPKKYHIGYVAGVFDMFHVGHVNLLRRAKEQCDYLIVGVVSDEDVYGQKKKYPIIPCEDRAEIVRSCRYADQVEILPEKYCGIRDAYKLYRFDCMFLGDDHRDETGWLADQEFLEKNGTDIVFFHYTEKISSTKLREQVETGGVEH